MFKRELGRHGVSLIAVVLAALAIPGGGQNGTGITVNASSTGSSNSSSSGSGSGTGSAAAGCAACPPGQWPAGCSAGVGGTCTNCTSCAAGNYTSGCGSSSSSMGMGMAPPRGGTCMACPGWGAGTTGASATKTFRSSAGSSPSCTACRSCGGANQDGSFYVASPCTPTSDTVCQLCPRCVGGTRFGCSGQSVGVCEGLIGGPGVVLSTASVGVAGGWVSSSRFTTTAPTQLSLRGSYAGASLSLRPFTSLDFPPNFSLRLSLSALAPNSRMLAGLAANLSSQAPMQLTMLSRAVAYITPTGTTANPLGDLALPFDAAAYQALVTASPPSRLGVFTWDDTGGSWFERPSGKQLVIVNGSQALVKLSAFGPTAVMGVTPVPSNITMLPTGPTKPVNTNTSVWVPVLISVASVTLAVLGAIYIFHKKEARVKRRELEDLAKKAAEVASARTEAPMGDPSRRHSSEVGSRQERALMNTPAVMSLANNTPMSAVGNYTPMAAIGLVKPAGSFGRSTNGLSVDSHLKSLVEEPDEDMSRKLRPSTFSALPTEWNNCMDITEEVENGYGSPESSRRDIDDADRKKAIQELKDLRSILLEAGIGVSMSVDEPPPAVVPPVVPPSVPPFEAEPGHSVTSEVGPVPYIDFLLPNNEHGDASVPMPRNSLISGQGGSVEKDIKLIFDVELSANGLRGVGQQGWHKLDNLLVNADFVIDSAEL